MEKEKKITLARVFAENIVTYRNKKGLSQYDLARITGITRAAISHYEREGIIPSADKLELLAQALGIPAYKLFYYPDKTISSGPADVTDIDARSVKKLRDILSLSAEDRNDLYRILNKMLRKNQLEQAEKG